MSDKKKMITDDDNFYWDTLRLADALYNQGKYEEAEELYKKIAGDEDMTGDANAHYGYLLDELGRYDEAYDCFARVLYGQADTSPREGVLYFLDENFLNEDSHYWGWYDDLDRHLSVYWEHCNSINKKPDIEKILLKCFKSEDPDRVWEPRRQLIRIYGTGKYMFDDGEVVSVSGFPDFEKLQTFVRETTKDEFDASDIISAICYDVDHIDEASGKALEAAWQALQYEEAVKKATEFRFWLYLSGCVFNLIDEFMYNIPSMQDEHKAAEMLLKLEAEKNTDGLMDMLADILGECSEVFEEAHRMDPDRAGIAFLLFISYIPAYRFKEVLQGLSDACARALIQEQDISHLFEAYLEFYCDDNEDDAEDFKLVYLSLLDFLCKYDPDGYCCDQTKQLILSAYQFGTYSYMSNEIEISYLKNREKAEAFARKYHMELLGEPFHY